MADTEDAVRLRAGRRTVEIHRPGKELFPAEGVTKEDLAAYYAGIAVHMVPELKGRPLMLERHPDGIGGPPKFMQKDTPDQYPRWITRAELPKEGGTVNYTVCNDAATLVFLADQACVTPHRWLSTVAHPRHPDRLVLDLDPPGEDDFPLVREAARAAKDLLDEVRLPARLMSTGSKGLHLVVPLDGSATQEECRDFARDLAELLAGRYPDRLTTAVRKNRRAGRLYLDIQRNAYGQTAVAPWAVRARRGAPVAVPLAWESLDDPGLGPRDFSAGDPVAVQEHARTRPWSDGQRARSLGPAHERLRRMG